MFNSELNSDLVKKVSASGTVYDLAFASFDVSDFKKVTYTLNANNGNVAGGNALVVDGTIKAYTKAYDASTLTASGTLDISNATTLEIRCYAYASTLNTGWGGTYTLEFS